MEEQSQKDLDALFDEDNLKIKSKDFGFGFIIGTTIFFLLIFVIFILKKTFEFKYKSYFIIISPIILFILLLVLITSSFKLKRDNIAYGIIIAIFLLPLTIFTVWFLTFMITII